MSNRLKGIYYMSHKKRPLAFCIGMILAVIADTGCINPTQGPAIPIPIPVSPYLQTMKENEFWERERYERVPIMGPLTAGGPAQAMDPPSDDEVMTALENADPVNGGIAFFHEVQRNNVRIIKEKIADYVDPPRFVPLIGPAQLHHAHYKCTVYYTRIVRVGWPVPHTLTDEDTREVLYIDHNHFHMVGDVNPGVGSPY